MRPALLLMCTLAATLTGCSRGPAPSDAVSADAAASRQTADSALPSAAPAPATPDDPSASATPARAGVTLALSGEGLDFVTERGSVRHLVFGTPAAQTVDAVSKTYSGMDPQRGHNAECGAGPLDMATWKDGLSVMLQGGRFVGWSVSPREAEIGDSSLTTIAGIGIGSTRRELEAAYTALVRETTLGQEFAAGDVFGVLDGAGPSARIIALWAGESCNFR